ncbi:chromosome partitioning protein ParB, partial [Enterococcus faecalis]
PFSYLDTKTKRWLDRKKQWKELGIKSELGREDNLVFSANLQAPGLEGTSIFDPVLCELGYRWFTPKTKSNIFDPFAGGSVRGIVAKVLGHNYTGIDLRAEQVSANYANAREIGLSDINWICDDSLDIDEHIENESQDLLFTCPPYADLEVYSDDERDISNMSYEEFAEAYSEILKRSARKLKDNRFAVVTISDVRDKKGFYRDLTGLTKQA